MSNESQYDQIGTCVNVNIINNINKNDEIGILEARRFLGVQ